MRLLTLLFSVNAVAFGLLDSPFVSLDQAERTWPQKSFKPTAFRAEDAAGRSAMAVDLIRKREFLGLKLHDVEASLGKANGHSDLGRALAYRLESAGDSDYQLVFLPDYSGRKVEDVKIERIRRSVAQTNRTEALSLPVNLEGSTAAQIFDLLGVLEIDGVKTSDQIRCSRQKCTMLIHPNGQIRF